MIDHSPKSRIAALIPHAGAMLLLDRVIDWDDNHIVCEASGHHDPGNPLRAAQRLAAVHLAEYAAQAMAIHGGLLAERIGTPIRPGLLATIRDLDLKIERLDVLDEPLVINAERLYGDDSGVLYAFTAKAGDETIGSGRIGIMTLTA